MNSSVFQLDLSFAQVGCPLLNTSRIGTLVELWSTIPRVSYFSALDSCRMTKILRLCDQLGYLQNVVAVKNEPTTMLHVELGVSLRHRSVRDPQATVVSQCGYPWGRSLIFLPRPHSQVDSTPQSMGASTTIYRKAAPRASIHATRRKGTIVELY